MSNEKYVIGVDFGTDSVRSIIVNALNGEIISGDVQYYRRWQNGDYCNPSANQFRQHPFDYIEGLEKSIKNALKNTSKDIALNIKGISVDTTGSTPVAVDKNCKPLALHDEFSENPNSMFVLWKDHTSVEEAAQINIQAKKEKIDYTKYVGGVYSSEWFWAKILHVLREDKKVRENAYSWVEHCDWIPALLTGIKDVNKILRSRCAAGHKAMWHEEFKGLPDNDFLKRIDPLLDGIKNNLYTDTYTNDKSAGTLCKEWAERLGLSEDVIIGVGAFDAHMGAIGGEIKPYELCKIIGTSTCDILVAPLDDVKNRLIDGICGQVNGSVIPDMMGMEAGQSAFGDIYAWFKNLLLWPVENILKGSKDLDDTIIPNLIKHAEKIKPGESNIISLDWMNGRRTPYANQLLKGIISGLNLGSDAPAIFRSLVEATAFGARKINERFIDEGIQINGIIALGGVAKKSPFIMQILADVLNMKIKVVKSDQACALGAGMCAAVAAGIYPSVIEAQKAMGNGFECEYVPNNENAEIYNKLYKKYSHLAEVIEENKIY